MITVSVDTSALKEKLAQFTMQGGSIPTVYDTVLRKVATTMLGTVKNRVHEDGKDASGGQIGTYTHEYMVVRTNSFQNNLKTKGKDKGKGRTTSAGEFTKGKNKGQARPIYNRTSDTKVVISLTRQMENDFVVIPTDKGYGLGYNNPDNKLKAGYVEATYKRKIFALTPDEQQEVTTIAQTELNNAIS